MWDVVPVPVARGAMAGAAPPDIPATEVMGAAEAAEVQPLVVAAAVAHTAAVRLLDVFLYGGRVAAGAV
jgi:hypothetical protein